jgi:hypothetical protein
MDRLNQWLMLVANVSVVAGIVFLALELQQNSKQVSLQSYQAWAANNVQIDLAMAEPVNGAIIAQGALDSRSLSRETFNTFAQLNMAYMQAAQTADYLYREGALDEELWDSEMSRVALILASPGVRQWWDAGGRSQLAPSFVDCVEAFPTKMNWFSWDADRGFIADEAAIAQRNAQGKDRSEACERD